MKRIFALGLVLVMSLAVLVSCDKTEPYSNPYSALTLEEIAACLEFADSYKEIAIKQSKIDEAFKNDYDAAVKEICKAYEETLGTGDVLQNGDVVSIHYSGILDGETTPFEGGTGDEEALELGSGAFIEGFEEGLVGKKVGETVVLNLTFPKDYIDSKKDAEGAAKLNGKKVAFTVEIKGGKTYPEFTDELVKKAFKDNKDAYYKYETVAEYKEAARKQIYANLAFAAYKNAVKVTSFPHDLMEKEYNSLVDQYRSYANANGFTLADFVTSYYMYYLGATPYKSVNDFAAGMKSQAASSVKNSFLVYYVYNSNKAEIDGMVEANKDRIVYEYSKSTGLTVEEIYDQIDETAINDLVINALVTEFIGSQCTVTDDVVTPTPTPSATPTVTPEATKTAE